MFVRLSSLQADPAKIDAGIRYVEHGMDKSIWEEPGFQGAQFSMDRASGRLRAFTYWDTEEHLLASAAKANDVRRRIGEAFGVKEAPVHEYFEVFHEVPRPGAKPAVQFLRTEKEPAREV